jgi:hypothetical protein
MLVSLTVGKVDAGVAVLLTEDNRLVKSPTPGGLDLPNMEDVVCGSAPLRLYASTASRKAYHPNGLLI